MLDFYTWMRIHVAHIRMAHTHTHTHLIHYMRIHIVPVYQLLNDLELAITAGQVETVCIILCTYV